MKKLFIALLFALATGATASAQYTTVRTNVLGLATGTVNVGVDVAVADKWSVDVSGYWNLISTERLQFNVLVGTVAVRRWRFEPHVGLFYGIIQGRQYRQALLWLDGRGRRLRRLLLDALAPVELFS